MNGTKVVKADKSKQIDKISYVKLPEQFRTEEFNVLRDHLLSSISDRANSVTTVSTLNTIQHEPTEELQQGIEMRMELDKQEDENVEPENNVHVEEEEGDCKSEDDGTSDNEDTSTSDSEEDDSSSDCEEENEMDEEQNEEDEGDE